MRPLDVLIIDDERAVRSTFARILEQSGFRTAVADDAAAAFARIKERSFDVILCDVTLPVVEGTAFYQQLARDVPQAADRVLFVTGRAADDNVVHTLASAGRPVLHKPVELSHLVAAVRQVALGQSA